MFSSSYPNFTRHDRSTHQNPASLEIPINVEESLLIRSFRTRTSTDRQMKLKSRTCSFLTRRHPWSLNSSWSHYNTITRTRNSQIKKAEMLLSAFFSHCLASLFRLAFSLQAFLQEKLVPSAFLQDSRLLDCRFESAD